MRINLVRHAESEANRLGITQGQKINSSLSKEGKKQAKLLAKKLKDEKIDVIYSSDLKRAKETAKEINKFHKLKIIYDKRLREKDYGEESLEAFVSRLLSFFNEIKDSNKNILIVAHVGVNLGLLAISTGSRKKGAKLIQKFNKQDNTCVNIIEKINGKFKIKKINCTKHLKK